MLLFDMKDLSFLY